MITTKLAVMYRHTKLKVSNLVVGVFLAYLAACPDIGYAAVQLKATEAKPIPNYKYTKDANDVSQLTNGSTVIYPMWIQQSAVGWSNHTPVSVSLSLKDTVATTRNRFSGTLRVHTTRRDKSAVKIPVRFDVYTETEPGKYAHAAYRQNDPSAYSDSSSHWLDIPVKAVTGKLLLVMHASGQFVFTDELEWQDGADDSALTLPAALGDASKVLADSTLRLKTAYQQLAAGDTVVGTGISATNTSVLNQLNNSNDVSVNKPAGDTNQSTVKAVVYPESPWDDLPMTIPASVTTATPSAPLKLYGTPTERETGAFAISNLSSSDLTVKLSLVDAQNNATNQILLRQVVYVLAADGKAIPDALKPFAAVPQVVVKPGKSAHIWVTANLIGLTPGKHNYLVKLQDDSGNALGQQAIELNVANLNPPKSLEGAVTWAYDTDKPIFNRPEEAKANLLDHGVNVFVIPNALIPRPTLTGAWEEARSLIFENELKRYAGHGKFMLYLNWREADLAGYNLTWLASNSSTSLTAKKLAVKNWLTKVNQKMAALGISKQDWMVYPVDEVRGSEINHFIYLAQLIRNADPSVQIYVNPIDTPSFPMTLLQLQQIAPYVDVWQPALAFAEKATNFFESVSPSWWLYSNPISPAKSASPIKHYRSMAWRAWSLGATGIGFWSYSSTRDSSAWDDFDGSRPDWAVVYEDTNSVVDSRRWEAFSEGINDYNLFTTLDSLGVLTAVQRDKIKNGLTQLSTGEQLNLFRIELLQPYLN